MKAYALLMLAGISGPAAAAPFCVVYAGGQMCNYYDTAACWKMARSLNGMCAANVQPQTQPAATQHTQPYDMSKAIQHPNTLESMQQGLRAGQEARMREEAQSRRREQQPQNWADAAIEALQSDVQPDLPPPSYHVLYQCGEEVTTTPAKGCVVIAAEYF